MFTPTLLISTLTLLGSTWAAPKSHADHDHVSYSQGGLGKRWYQDSDSETAKLFRRAPANAGTPGESKISGFRPGFDPRYRCLDASG